MGEWTRHHDGCPQGPRCKSEFPDSLCRLYLVVGDLPEYDATIGGSGSTRSNFASGDLIPRKLNLGDLTKFILAEEFGMLFDYNSFLEQAHHFVETHCN
ncbi:hypothetical protein PILCRDRAFT_830493 [Piloderma croceum F 1598]|uniref:Uncharacterized protein n=1 Tax=Piloderma croceum (strain F 1598) TaxID=765440 RepID=A0A0C3B1V6_PILCF|nr:hypothetical protein PILCRDRAFT_830493 [Piloderma croceum F 1598]